MAAQQFFMASGRVYCNFMIGLCCGSRHHRNGEDGSKNGLNSGPNTGRISDFSGRPPPPLNANYKNFIRRNRKVTRGQKFPAFFLVGGNFIGAVKGIFMESILVNIECYRRKNVCGCRDGPVYYFIYWEENIKRVSTSREFESFVGFLQGFN